jgi:hypothetical protein
MDVAELRLPALRTPRDRSDGAIGPLQSVCGCGVFEVLGEFGLGCGSAGGDVFGGEESWVGCGGFEEFFGEGHLVDFGGSVGEGHDFGFDEEV